MSGSVDKGEDGNWLSRNGYDRTHAEHAGLVPVVEDPRKRTIFIPR